MEQFAYFLIICMLTASHRLRREVESVIRVSTDRVTVAVGERFRLGTPDRPTRRAQRGDANLASGHPTDRPALHGALPSVPTRVARPTDRDRAPPGKVHHHLANLGQSGLAAPLRLRPLLRRAAAAAATPTDLTWEIFLPIVSAGLVGDPTAHPK